MSRRTYRVGALLFVSGVCGLIYETVWLRELRLIFGASTMASAAVVACFIGGLGIGGLLLGKRSDAHPCPLKLYATLEAGIAAFAAVTPALLWLVRKAYIATGGTQVLGAGVGTVVRLVLAAFVFAAPTLLMGGTLPAAARAIEDGSDTRRRGVAVLYGINTLGAVVGCLVATFVLFEVFGTRVTLWLACLVNLLVAVVARSMARTLPSPSGRAPTLEQAPPTLATPAEPVVAVVPGGGAPAWLVLVGAASVGFVFCLMELVWYRMLTPLLGGTVFTFGLILAVALLGIGLGGLLYAGLRAERRPTVHGFAVTCLLEALLVAIPYALGDRIAVFAEMLRATNPLGFAMQALTWSFVTGIVVFGAAFVSGFQFPWLIGLLGEGDAHVGRHVGLAYASNTGGAIVGSLAGGFGLLPLLTATGCWKLSVGLLIVLGGLALAYEIKARGIGPRLLAPAVLALFGVLLVTRPGPTAAWRHAPIGAGRVTLSHLDSPNDVLNWEHEQRSRIVWQAEGRESAIALERSNGYAFVVNGKVDGAVRGDASTVVMLGMLGAFLHPHPTRSMVIGLGTGMTAGWLGRVPAMTDVDVAELEPAILEVARRSAPMNENVLDNPKVHIQIGDARELLLASKRTYDLVASEPSNPYRAGVASLFTKEFYEAVASRLEEGGLFLQWVQAYEINGQTVRTIYATLASVFPHVETWQIAKEDMLLVGSMRPIDYDVPRLRTRLTEEPFRRALTNAWRATDLEAVLAHYVATPGLAARVAEQEGDAITTDDMNLVEFGLARSLGTGVADFTMDDLRRVAHALHLQQPSVHAGEVDWERVEDETMAAYAESGWPAIDFIGGSAARARRAEALVALSAKEYAHAVEAWRAQPKGATGNTEPILMAYALASTGDPRALDYVSRLRAFRPTEADAIVGRLRLREGNLAEATEALQSVFVSLRHDAWPMELLMTGALADAKEIVVADSRFAEPLYAALREPFSVLVYDDARAESALTAAMRVTRGAPCVEALARYEPNVPWIEAFLEPRFACYAAAASPRAAQAKQDLLVFGRMRPPRFAPGLL